MRILHVASEIAPWAQSGGLADVVAALPVAVAGPETFSTVVAPLYRGVAARLAAGGITLDEGIAHDVALGTHRLPVRVRRAITGEGPIWFVDSPLYDRDGFYHAPGGPDFADNHVRFGLLSRAAIDLGDRLLGGPVDILHAHDWQAGLAPVFLRLDPARGRTAAVFTVHNLAFRGLCSRNAVEELDLPWEVFNLHRMEYWGLLSLLKGGLAYADVVTTVSPTYAREILTPEGGEGLSGFLRWDVERLVGILNGIDADAWDPARDRALAAPYCVDDPSGKARCRAALATEIGFPDDRAVIISVVSRLADQKGVDLVADLAPELAGRGARLIVLGSGDPRLEARFRELGEEYPEHVRAIIGFDVALSRRIYAGSDLFLMPSRFEPCGIGQLYAMRYGSVPVVHAVGGLVDTVVDPGDDGLAAGAGTGFRFTAPTVEALRGAVKRALRLYRERPDGWRTLVQAAMRRDSSWREPAREYLQLYRASVRARR